MVSFNIILRNDTVVLYSGLVQKVGGVSLLKKRMTNVAKQQELQERLEDLDNFLDEQTEAITEYSEVLVRRLIEKITVYDEKLVVEFKSGLQIEVEA